MTSCLSGAALASLAPWGASAAEALDKESRLRDAQVGAGLADPQRPAFTVPAPTLLQASRHERTWATVKTPTPVRAAAGRREHVVARLAPRTPEGTTNIVHARRRTKDGRGSLWIQVRVPGRHGTITGWVPRRALGGYAVVTTRLVVDLGDRAATLFRDGKAVFRAPVGIGTASAPTPTGEFYVRNKLTRYQSPFYGPLAFGTSAKSPTLTDWPAGGFIGIHGTNRPDLIPGAVSHGCIRLRNEDIVRLAKLMPVGTALTIRA